MLNHFANVFAKSYYGLLCEICLCNLFGNRLVNYFLKFALGFYKCLTLAREGKRNTIKMTKQNTIRTGCPDFQIGLILRVGFWPGRRCKFHFESYFLLFAFWSGRRCKFHFSFNFCFAARGQACTKIGRQQMCAHNHIFIHICTFWVQFIICNGYFSQCFVQSSSTIPIQICCVS